jgi:hypothetical protein
LSKNLVIFETKEKTPSTLVAAQQSLEFLAAFVGKSFSYFLQANSLKFILFCCKWGYANYSQEFLKFFQDFGIFYNISNYRIKTSLV